MHQISTQLRLPHPRCYFFAPAAVHVLKALLMIVLVQFTTPLIAQDFGNKSQDAWNWDAQLCVDMTSDHITALDHCDRAIVSGDLTSESLAATFNNRGWHYQNLGDIEKALSDFARSIELDSDQSSAYYNRGILFEKLGDLDRAKQDFETAHHYAPELDHIRDKALEYGLQLQSTK